MDSTVSRSSFLPAPPSLFGRRRRASSQLSREVSSTPQTEGEQGALDSLATSRGVILQDSTTKPVPNLQNDEALVTQTQTDDKPMEHYDDINIPAPITKDPPFFDPYTATPIFEENTFSQSRAITHIPEDWQEEKASPQPEETEVKEEVEREAGEKEETTTQPLAVDTTAVSEDEVSADEPLASNVRDSSREQTGTDMGEDWVMVDENERLERPPSPPSPPSPMDAPPPPPPVVDTSTGVEVNEKQIQAKGHNRARSSTSIIDRPRGSYDLDAGDRRPYTAFTAAVPPQMPTPQTHISEASASKNQGNSRSWNVDSAPSRIQQLQSEAQLEHKSSFKGLPPIRRSSSFGLGLDLGGEEREDQPRQDVSYVPEEVTPQKGQAPRESHEREIQESIIQRQNQNGERTAGIRQSNTQPVSTLASTPPNHQRTSSKPTGLRQSNASPTSPSQTNRWSTTAARWNEPIPPQNRAVSDPQQGFPVVSPLSSSGRTQRGVSMPLQSGQPFQHPPSSAQRYPELFRQDNNQQPQLTPGDELPAHYYQPAISPEEAFLPRQQTNEYQLPGVGPPRDDPGSSNPKRNPGFLRDIGGRMRAGSRARDEPVVSPASSPALTGGFEYADSINSGIVEEQRKSQPRPFSGPGLTRLSSPASGPPRSRESTMGHHPGSISNMLTSSPTTETSKGEQGRLRSLFKREDSNSASPAKTRPSRLIRASTGGSGLVEEDKKKGRFSAIGGMFGKSSKKSWKSASEGAQSVAGDSRPTLERRSSLPPQATAALQKQRMENAPARAPVLGSHDLPQNAPSQQKRGLLAKVQTANSGVSEPKPPQPGKNRESSRTRRPSGTAIIGGLLGRRSNQYERDAEPQPARQSSQNEQSAQQPSAQISAERRSQEPQGKRLSQQFDLRLQGIPRPQDIYPPNLYNDAQRQSANARTSQKNFQPRGDSLLQADKRLNRQIVSPRNETEIPWQGQPDQEQERGRRQEREEEEEPVPEPIYDAVPIPGGYSMVHSQGGIVVPSAYDPRGPPYYPPQQFMNHQYPYAHHQLPPPFFPGYIPPQGPYQQHPGYLPPQAPYQQYPEYMQPPPQGEPYQWYGPPMQSPPLSDEHMNNSSSSRHLSVESIERNFKKSRHRRPLSREDLIARSPARLIEGQQRPYQISLPEGADDDDEEELEQQSAASSSQRRSSSTPLSPPPPQMNRNSPSLQPQGLALAQRPSQPMIRHPESPAGYPLPESTFSPINPSAANLPPPPLPNPSPPKQRSPPPKSVSPSSLPPNPGQLVVSKIELQPRRKSLTNLNRSDTDRTNTSGVSLLSRDPFEQAEQEDSLALPSEKDLEGELSSTPPSIHLTPEPRPPVADARAEEEMLTTRRQVVRIPSSTSDLYDASPKNTKPPEYTLEDENRGRTSLLMAQQQQPMNNHHNTRPRSRDEKILVEPNGSDREGSRSAAGSSRGRMLGDDEREQEERAAAMSATSYPGQEWNPFANGGYVDDWND